VSGVFITFEGGEGAGKTTLIEKVMRWLVGEGREVLRTREPGGTPLGEEIRTLLLQPRETELSPYTELCLFLASRAQHIREIILPALKLGKIVLCDRFNDSSIAYQGVARGLGREKVQAVCAFASEGLTPHLTLYLDIDPETGLRRAKNSRAQDRIESEDIAFHTRIRDGYLAIAKADPKRFCLLDASQPPETVFHQAMHLLRRHV